MPDPAEADALQHAWLLPYEMVDLTPELEDYTPAVIADDGTLFQPTAAQSPAEAEIIGMVPPVGPRFAYGMTARTDNKDRVVATDDWAVPEAEQVLERISGEMNAWLLRMRQYGGGTELMPLRGPEEIVPRPVLEGPVAVLVDLGMVLTHFDRAQFQNCFLAVFGKPPPQPALDLLQEMRTDLESGSILVDDFLDRALEPLGLVRPDREALQRVWASILTVKKSTTHLVRRLAARSNVAVVVVSNTDPIMLRHLQADLGLGDLTESIAASCQDGVNPKGTDTSLWKRARDTAAQQLGEEPQEVIAVDDVRSYLEAALADGVATAAVHYRHYAQLKYELGAMGLYLPLERESLLEA